MDAVAEVKSRLNIEDVISQYVQLKRAGRNFKGLSPWTNEKTASFMVSPEKQIWHDFSSGKGGDVFSFVMEMEGLDFKGALEMLARQAGVDLDQFRGAKPNVNAQNKARVLSALELATKFYQKQLTANKAALGYLLKQRKFTKQTVLDWRFGYAPNTGSALTDFLTKHGYTTVETRRAGLTVERQSRPVDMFRGRIIIPLTDSRGTVVGFTARLLIDEPNAPKYINTPQTIVYDKSRNVFGLNLSKEAIRKKGFVVAVEGNLDVVSSHQAGVKNVVASAGTAMTEQHLRELKRFTGDIRLCFDADRAGVAATERVIPLAQKIDVNMSIIELQGAKDPDELIQKDLAAWEKTTQKPIYAPDWLIEHYRKQLDLKSAQGKKTFTDAVVATIRRLRDPVEQEHYVKKVAQLTDTSVEAVRTKFARTAPDNQIVRLKKSKVQNGQIDRQAVEYQRFQDHFLAMTLVQPRLRDLLKDATKDYFSGESRQAVLEFLKKHPSFKGDPKVAEQLQAHADYVKIISLQFEELYQELPLEDLQVEAERLKHRLIDRYVKMQKTKLAEAMQNAPEERLHQLMLEANKLNELIKK